MCVCVGVFVFALACLDELLDCSCCSDGVACPDWCHGVLPYSSWHRYVLWQELDSNTPYVDFFWHAPQLSQHWGCLNTICPWCDLLPILHPLTSVLHKSTLLISSILQFCPHWFLQLIFFFFFWQSLKAQSGWYPAHLTAATTNRFLWPSVNVKPSKWLLLSHPPWPHLISILLFPTLYLLLASLTYFPLLHFHLILPCILPPNFYVL